jgi:hypothetical protein
MAQHKNRAAEIEGSFMDLTNGGCRWFSYPRWPVTP